MSIFERTKEVAKLRGLNLRQLEKEAGLSERSIYNWKLHNPNNQSLLAVANVLGVSTDYLLGNTDEMTPNKSTIPSEEKLDQALDRSISYDGKEITDHDRKLLKAMLTSYFENKDDNSK